MIENVGTRYYRLRGKVEQGNIEVINNSNEYAVALEGRANTVLLTVKFKGLSEMESPANTDFTYFLFWETEQGDTYRQVLVSRSGDLVLEQPQQVDRFDNFRDYDILHDFYLQ